MEYTEKSLFRTIRLVFFGFYFLTGAFSLDAQAQNPAQELPLFQEEPGSGPDSMINPGENSGEPENREEKEIGDPARNYLNMAVNYINRGRYDQAKRYLDMAQGAGDENIYFEAEIWKLFLSGVEGKKNVESNLQLLTGEDQAKGHYFLADGWQAHYENHPEKKEILELAIEYREKLVAQFPESKWARQASMQLVPLFYQKKDYDKALFYLLTYFESRHLFEDQNDDKAWFYFGKIMESPSEYRDLHKALKAYLKVLENPESQYYQQAVERIRQIEKFYYITP